MKLIYLSVTFFSISSWASLTEILVKEVSPTCKLTKETKFHKKKFVIRHLKDCEGAKSYLYLDNHTVRTMNEVLMIEVKGNKIQEVRTLKFYEPKEYKASVDWLSQLKGRVFGNLKMGEKLDAITGATLTSHAIVNNVAKILKIHQSLKDGSK